ncbi:multidrug resistance-associated protein 1-like isoform X4 [Daphnia pulicaria]|uniref:multidrug resistance-associated protein 1-like isoform X4 n=1 Tax=Daphnia pulicaria TaxID=35523 RepID=UPI001EEA1643|nr:multidrug resistance-associated protein 1-like isoform X4 [Daphnia pulicaria]
MGDNQTDQTSPLDSFCGSTFWDLDQTWNTNNPSFTECFHQTVLYWIPCGFIWLLAPYETYQILYSNARYIPWSIFNISKMIINLLLIILSIISIIYAVIQSNNDVQLYTYDVYYVTPAILAATFVLTLGLMLAEKKRGIRSSGPLFMFWFLLTLCGGFTYADRIKSIVDGMDSLEAYPFVWEMVYYPFVVAMLFINCFADKEPLYMEGEGKSENPCPEEGSSFLNVITYSWLDTLVWKGYRKPLETGDLWDLNSRDKSKSVVPRFEKHWLKSLSKQAKYFWDNFGKPSEPKATYGAENGGVTFKPSTSSKKIISILPALCKTFAPEFLLGALLKLVQDLLAFVSPQILSLLIGFVEDTTQESWKGYLYAAILTITAMTQTLILGQYFQRMFIIGMQIRTSIVSSIYRKAIKISNSARKESTVGEIVNLMSVDAQRLMDLTTYLNMLWSAPLQIALAIYFLYQILGPSVFAGLGVMILLIPINGVLANATKKLQIQQMKYKDKRVKMMSEILSGIKVLKLYAWEPSFQAQVEDIRNKEIKVLKQAAYLSAGTSFLWTCAPFLVTLATFAVYVTTDPSHILNAKKAFVSLTLFNLLRFPMSMFPMLVVSFVQASVSIKRLNKFMNADELDPESVSHETTASAINIEKGSFAWSQGEQPILKDINIEIKPGKLVAVVGQVGAGKSSLISAILGEMEKLGGKANTNGKIAYIPQQAWIQNCSLRNNIMFGKTYNESFYNKVINACALKPDLAMLPGGDSTEIGEKGINLSGGQKQRVSLARSVYSDMDVYLLDDPLSAVDSHVGKHIFDEVIGPKGLLKAKTRLLVTHGITFLPQVDQIIVLKNGEVSEVGSYKELLAQKGAFAEFLLQHLEEEGADEDDIPDELAEIKQELENTMGKEEFARQISRQRATSETQSQNSENAESKPMIASPDRSLSRSNSTTSMEKSGGSLRRRSSAKDRKSVDGGAPVAKPNNTKLIEAEKTETGKVNSQVYVHYLRSVGGWLSFITLILYIIYQGFAVYSNIWLAKWSEAGNSTVGNHTVEQQRDIYLGVYGALGLGQSLFSFSEVLLYYALARASRVLHEACLKGVLHAPMTFFETVPIGRIMSRFSQDMNAIDSRIPAVLVDWLYCLLEVISTILVIGLGTPIFFAVAVPIGVLYYWIQNVYVATSRQLKRLESVSRSPIYSHFGETLTGATVIRAYGQEHRFIKESESRVDLNQICYYPSIVANRWLSIRLETIGNLVVLFASLFAVIEREKGTMDPGYVGLSITYALSITQTLNWFMRMTSEVETNIVAVERIKEYSEAVQEASWDHGKREPPNSWPDKGKVSFEKYEVRYREGLDLVIKGITCDIQGGEKVGIVGRTGAGKSSLTLALFRIIEAASGKITIDGLDIADLGLHALRSRLTIIPQDPVLFSGTLRMNLDPFNSYSDDDIWTALEHAHLKTFVKSLPAGLEHEASEGGENLSVGQRQLICLARALLRKTKVLILDEATAAVDLETDDLIQATIRKEFKEGTVITIAHRLNTILDSNRVMVLDKGEIKEYAPPNELLENKESIFYGMARDAGLLSKITTMDPFGQGVILAPGEVKPGHMIFAPLRTNLMAHLSTCCQGETKSDIM